MNVALRIDVEHKIFTTTKPYHTEKYGYKITVPKGSKATNQKACGVDDNYRFWTDFRKVAEEITKYPSSGLAHDLEYYGLNIPKEYFI